MYYIPLFGFEITRQISLSQCIIHPVYSDPAELRKQYISDKPVPCTAIVESEILDRQFLFWLEIACTLADHRSSQASHPLVASTLSEALEMGRGEQLEFARPQGPGRLILGDEFAVGSRQSFLQKALETAYNTRAPSQPEFCQMLHKTALCYQGGAAEFVEIKYFMLFSGLEALARKIQNYSGHDSAKPLADYISSHGFSFFQDRKDKPFR
ncbi:MAG: hypothetical protein MRY77_13415, partial [Rhodobacteraceae bacterium]|nr:hypothetical protein [Paracoccaceae bacterium]